MCLRHRKTDCEWSTPVSLSCRARWYVGILGLSQVRPQAWPPKIMSMKKIFIAVVIVSFRSICSCVPVCLISYRFMCSFSYLFTDISFLWFIYSSIYNHLIITIIMILIISSISISIVIIAAIYPLTHARTHSRAHARTHVHAHIQHWTLSETKKTQLTCSTLLKKVGEGRGLPVESKTGHLVKLPKKDDLSQYKKCQRTILLSVSGEVMRSGHTGRLKDVNYAQSKQVSGKASLTQTRAQFLQSSLRSVRNGNPFHPQPLLT